MGNCAYCNREVSAGEFICASCSTPSVYETAPSVTIAEPDKLKVQSSEPIVQPEALISAMENVDVFQSTKNLIPGLETDLDPQKTDPGKFEVGASVLSSEVLLDRENSQMTSDESVLVVDSKQMSNDVSELAPSTNTTVPPVAPPIVQPAKSRTNEKKKAVTKKKTKKKVAKAPDVKPIQNLELFDRQENKLDASDKEYMINELENSYSSTYLTTVDQKVEVPYSNLNRLNGIAQANAQLARIPDSKKWWSNTKVHNDLSSSAGFLIVLIVGFFMFFPFLTSGVLGVFSSIFFLVVVIFAGSALNNQISGTEWNRYLSWVYENANSEPCEFIVESKTEPYTVVNFYLIKRKKKDDIPYRALKLNTIKYSNSQQYLAYVRAGSNPNEIFKGSVYLKDDSSPKVAILVAGGTRFWCMVDSSD